MNATDVANLDRDALIALTLKQAAIIDAPRAEIEALKCSGERQAAPSSKGTRETDPTIDPTNNRAARASRPAVIARKVSQCTKTPAGTRAFEARTGVVQTLSRTHQGPELLQALVRAAQPTALPPP